MTRHTNNNDCYEDAPGSMEETDDHKRVSLYSLDIHTLFTKYGQEKRTEKSNGSRIWKSQRWLMMLLLHLSPGCRHVFQSATLLRIASKFLLPHFLTFKRHLFLPHWRRGEKTLSLWVCVTLEMLSHISQSITGSAGHGVWAAGDRNVRGWERRRT